MLKKLASSYASKKYRGKGKGLSKACEYGEQKCEDLFALKKSLFSFSAIFLFGFQSVKHQQGKQFLSNSSKSSIWYGTKKTLELCCPLFCPSGYNRRTHTDTHREERQAPVPLFRCLQRALGTIQQDFLFAGW